MNFALFLLILLVVTGGVWAIEAAFLRKRRPSTAKQPWWVEYSVSFFPVILIVFLLRSFLIEPFKIPSSSMVPTLLVGDFILVNKFTYGIRLPVANKKIVQLGNPARGDVMVFRFPEDPSLDYIKRVIGVPGDTVEVKEEKVYINGVAIEEDYILSTPNYTYGPSVVPEGKYFVLGDNRDNANDNRGVYGGMGFVPEANLLGRMDRILASCKPDGRFFADRTGLAVGP